MYLRVILILFIIIICISEVANEDPRFYRTRILNSNAVKTNMTEKVLFMWDNDNSTPNTSTFNEEMKLQSRITKLEIKLIRLKKRKIKILRSNRYKSNGSESTANIDLKTEKLQKKINYLNNKRLRLTKNVKRFKESNKTKNIPSKNGNKKSKRIYNKKNKKKSGSKKNVVTITTHNITLLENDIVRNTSNISITAENVFDNIGDNSSSTERPISSFYKKVAPRIFINNVKQSTKVMPPNVSSIESTNSLMLQIPNFLKVMVLNTTKSAEIDILMEILTTLQEDKSNLDRKCKKRKKRCSHICKGGNCYCPAGFYLSGDKQTCNCPTGFKSNDGETCIDINECHLNNKHGPCQGTCINIKGWYRCSCVSLAGTRLSSDGHSCEDIDECIEGTSGCSHGCINTKIGVYCTCPEGMAMGGDQKTCEDINECEDEETMKKCAHGCTNTIGSYECSAEFLMMDNHNVPDTLTCRPLSPPAVGYYACSKDQALDTKMTSFTGRKLDLIRPGTICKFYCEFLGDVQYSVLCGSDGYWVEQSIARINCNTIKSEILK